jgi:hypothetical protein
MHLSIGVQWNTDCIMTPFFITLFTPMKARVSIVCLCLIIQDFGRSPVARTARDRASFHDVSSIIQFYVQKWISILI